MYIPNINSICLARLYDDHPPQPVRIESICENNPHHITIVILAQSPNSTDETRVIDINENGFRFFDAPTDSRYYYLLLKISDNHYDALDVNEGETFMDINEAMAAADALNEASEHDFQVAARRLNK